MKRAELEDIALDALQISKVLSMDKSKLAIVKLVIDSAYLMGRMEAVAEYEGILYAADQPIPYELTEKAKDELIDPNEKGEELFDAATAVAPVPYLPHQLTEEEAGF